jgi:hypothetical protein
MNRNFDAIGFMAFPLGGDQESENLENSEEKN